MNMLRTDRTYKSYHNAVQALERACKKVGVKIEDMRYVIAATPDGRFAPVVMLTGDVNYQMAANALVFEGVTVCN